MLVLARKPGQSIQIGDDVTVEVLGIQGKTVKLAFRAPTQINILRSELRAKTVSRLDNTLEHAEAA